MKEALFDTLSELTALDGVAGFEQDVVRHLRDAFADLADDVEVDSMGNLYATRRGSGDGPRVMVAAHSDEIGAMVKSIDEQGFLRFDTLGGVIAPMLLGRRVRVRGCLGVIGVKSGHLQTSEERQEVFPPDELYIDVGANSAEEVGEMGIGVGDPIAYYSPLLRYENDDRVCGKSIDNRIGCAILLELFRQL
ncbi:MAG: M42 family peptidase, partial [Anaerolineae bacterium]